MSRKKGNTDELKPSSNKQPPTRNLAKRIIQNTKDLLAKSPALDPEITTPQVSVREQIQTILESLSDPSQHPTHLESLKIDPTTLAKKLQTIDDNYALNIKNLRLSFRQALGWPLSVTDHNLLNPEAKREWELTQLANNIFAFDQVAKIVIDAVNTTENQDQTINKIALQIAELYEQLPDYKDPISPESITEWIHMVLHQYAPLNLSEFSRHQIFEFSENIVGNIKVYYRTRRLKPRSPHDPILKTTPLPSPPTRKLTKTRKNKPE